MVCPITQGDHKKRAATLLSTLRREIHAGAWIQRYGTNSFNELCVGLLYTGLMAKTESGHKRYLVRILLPLANALSQCYYIPAVREPILTRRPQRKIFIQYALQQRVNFKNVLENAPVCTITD